MDHDLSMSLMLLWKWPNAVAYVWVSQITVLSGKNVLPNIFLPSALSKCLQMEWVQRAQIWYDKGFNLKFYKLVDCGRWISVSKFLPIFVYILSSEMVILTGTVIWKMAIARFWKYVFTECFCRGPVERRRRIKMTGMEKVTYFIESKGTFSISRIPKQYQITW